MSHQSPTLDCPAVSFSDADWELIEEIAATRAQAQRNRTNYYRGELDEDDAKDVIGVAGEYALSKRYGLPLPYASPNAIDFGDEHYDHTIRLTSTEPPLSVEVNVEVKATPRMDGNLLITEGQTIKAEMYVLCIVDDDARRVFLPGYALKMDVEDARIRTRGLRRPAHFIKRAALRPMPDPAIVEPVNHIDNNTHTMSYDDYDYDLSASRLKTHASCPEKYRQKYILGRSPTKAKAGYGEMGSWVHKTIENVLLANDVDTRTGQVRINKDAASKHELRSRLKQEFYRLEDSDEIETVNVTDDQTDTALECLQTAARYLAKGGFSIEGLEQTVYYNIDNPSIDKTAYGKMDVVTKGGEIWDWKTGRVGPSYTPRDELIQGAIYMAGYHNEYGELPSAIKFVYLHPQARERTESADDGPCERQIEPTQDTWQDMLRYARQLVQDEQTDTFEAKPESGKCYFCGYEMYCPASDVGVGGVNEAMTEGEVGMWDAV